MRVAGQIGSRLRSSLGGRRTGVPLAAAVGLMVVLVSWWLAAGGTLAPAPGTTGTAVAAPSDSTAPSDSSAPSGSTAPSDGTMPDSAAPSGGAASSDGAVTEQPDQAADGLEKTNSEDAAGPAPGAGIMAAPAPGTAPATAPRMSKIAPPAPVPTAPPVPVDVVPDRSIVRTARLGLTVADLPAVSATVRDAAASVGGYVAAEHSVDTSASFTLRVPSARLDELMGRLAAAGTVTERYGQAEDVTDQMVDLQSRLATQQASVARVRALLARATTVGEVVSVESELTSREADLESLQRRLASVGGRVELSTLTVSLVPAPAAAPRPVDGGGFAAGLAAGWRAFVTAAAGVLTAFGAVLPFLVLLAVVAGVVLLGRRALRRHRAATAALAAVSGGNSGAETKN